MSIFLRLLAILILTVFVSLILIVTARDIGWPRAIVLWSIIVIVAAAVAWAIGTLVDGL